MKPDQPSTNATNSAPAPEKPTNNVSVGKDPTPTPNTLYPEPLSRPAPQMDPQTAALPIVTPKKRHRVRNAVIIVLALAVIGLLICTALLYTYSRKIAVATLVPAKTADISYLRPRQWKAITAGDLQGYGDLRAKDGKSTALVIVIKVSTQFPSLTGDVDSEYYAQLRQSVVDGITPESITTPFKNFGSGCDEMNNIAFTKEIDTTSTPTAIGLFTTSETCTNSKTKPTLKLRGVVGKDGYIRMIGVFAPESDWKLNSAAFQKILLSVDQAKPGA